LCSGNKCESATGWQDCGNAAPPIAEDFDQAVNVVRETGVSKRSDLRRSSARNVNVEACGILDLWLINNYARWPIHIFL